MGNINRSHLTYDFVSRKTDKKVDKWLKREQSINDNEWNVFVLSSKESFINISVETLREIFDPNYDFNSIKKQKIYESKILINGYIRLYCFENNINIPSDINKILFKFFDINLLYHGSNHVNEFILNKNGCNFKFMCYEFNEINPNNKWINYFDYINSLVYISNISLFNQYYKNGYNKFISDLTYFNYWVNLQCFKHAPIILIFTGILNIIIIRILLKII